VDDLAAQLRDYIDGVADSVELAEIEHIAGSSGVAPDQPDSVVDATMRPNGSRPERAYLVEHAGPLAKRRTGRRPVIGALAAAAAVVVAAVAVVVTWPSARHQSTTAPTTPPTPATSAAPLTTTATPLTASRVAQMLANGQFTTIAGEIQPPFRRSADRVILEQAWGDLTNEYGTLLSTGTQDEDLFPPLAAPDSPGAVVDETVLQMLHGLIMLRVTLSPDRALVHVELLPSLAFWPSLSASGPGFTGPPSGF
jgi:hypothetical protein